MRQTLWAKQMISNKDLETIQAGDYIHIHVIPTENKELLNKVYSCSSRVMETTWRSCLKDQSKYIVISPKELLAPIKCVEFQPLLNYLKLRYW